MVVGGVSSIHAPRWANRGPKRSYSMNISNIELVTFSRMAYVSNGLKLEVRGVDFVAEQRELEGTSLDVEEGSKPLCLDMFDKLPHLKSDKDCVEGSLACVKPSRCSQCGVIEDLDMSDL
jgi:hypothetical protein